MSGLVSGLQNRVRRFESARNLKRPFRVSERPFCIEIFPIVLKVINQKSIFFYLRSYFPKISIVCQDSLAAYRAMNV